MSRGQGPRLAIVGVGETPVGRLECGGSLELSARAAVAAVKDSGLEPKDIDGLLCGGSLIDGMFMYNARLANYLGIQPMYASMIPLGGAAFGHAIMEAENAIKAGLCRHVLVVAGDPLLSQVGSKRAISMFGSFQDADYELPYGYIMPAAYAMVARRHMHEYGTTPEQLAQVAVSARRHASANPLAQYRDPLDIQDVLDAPRVATPLGVYYCSPISDGAGAFVVSSAERARHLTPRAVRVLGVGEGHQWEYSSPKRVLTSSGAAISAPKAFAQAGLTPDDCDAAQIYDCFTITVVVSLEDLGFCAKGEGGAFVEGGRIEVGGELPVNTHGGLLSHGHPGAPAGIFHVIEAVKQLRGEVEEERLMENCQVCLVHGNSGVLRDSVTLILGRD